MPSAIARCVFPAIACADLRYAKFAPDVGVAPMKKMEGLFGDQEEDEGKDGASAAAQ